MVKCWYDNPEVQGPIPGGCSDFLVFEASISKRPEFRADQESAIKNPRSKIRDQKSQQTPFFGPTEGRKVMQPRA